jgi:mannose-6-phosphate isomerase-like protein (cupin superfamily)
METAGARDIEATAKRQLPLMSIQRPRARVSIHFRHGDVQVMEVEIGAEGSLSEPTLWGSSSWHLVVEGQAMFHQGERDWEILPEQSLRLSEALPYTIVNPGPDPLRVLSVVATGCTDLDESELL